MRKKCKITRFHLYTIGYSILGFILLFLACFLVYLVSKLGLLESGLLSILGGLGLYFLASVSCLFGFNALSFVFHILFLNYD